MALELLLGVGRCVVGEDGRVDAVGDGLGLGLRVGFGDGGLGVGAGDGAVDDGVGRPVGNPVGAAWAAAGLHASSAAAVTATAVTRARTADHQFSRRADAPNIGELGTNLRPRSRDRAPRSWTDVATSLIVSAAFIARARRCRRGDGSP